MKKLCFSFISLIIFLSGFAQIKVFPGGTTVLGDLNLTGTASKFTVIGNSTFLQSNTSFISAPHIHGNNGYSSPTTPDYTWWGNDQTGIFHPNPNIIGFTISGSERYRISSNGSLYYYLYSSAAAGAFGDGALNLGNNSNVGPRALSIQAQLGDWQQAVNADITRPLAVGYRCKYIASPGWYVTGFGWMFSMGNYIGSDAAFKTNVSTITNGLQTVMNLRGVKFNYLGEIQNPSLFGGTVSQYYGFLAQETQTAIPGGGVVKTGEDGNAKYISYTSIIPFAVEAIKELKTELDSIKHVTDSLQKQITDCCTKSNNGNHNGQNNRINPNQDFTNDNNTSYIKQNNPNPFSRETFIEYFIAEKNAASSIMIFDMSGKHLKTLKLDGTGKGSVIINGSGFQPGMYYYSLIINNKEVDTKKMILTE